MSNFKRFFKVCLVIIILLIANKLQAQTPTLNDSVILGTGDSLQCYYKIFNGQKVFKPLAAWNIAFQTQGITFGIWLNEAAGCRAYVYPKGDTSNWSTVDTIGINSWPALHNSDTTWATGAFDQNSTAAFDVGWGWYTGPPNHFVIGDSINIVVLPNGQVKKLWLVSLKNTVYYFRYANLDGTGLVEDSIRKADFTTKNMGYYSLQHATKVDQEPVMDNWDLLFTRSLKADSVAPALYNAQLGSVYLNHLVLVKELGGVDVNTVYFDQSTAKDSTITAIGLNYQQKVGNVWATKDSLAYIVADRNSRVFKIIFTGLDTTTGKVVFSKTEFQAQAGIGSVNDSEHLSLFPNPATNQLNVVFSSTVNGSAIIIINDIAGKQVFQTTHQIVNGINQYQIPIVNLPAGMWLLNISTPSGNVNTKFIKTN